MQGRMCRGLLVAAGFSVIAGVLLAGLRAQRSSVEPSAAAARLELNELWTGIIGPNQKARWQTESLESTQLYTLSVSVEPASLPPGARYGVSLTGPGDLDMGKILHEGDPSLFLTFRPRQHGRAILQWTPQAAQWPAGLPESRQAPEVQAHLTRLELAAHEQLAFESEPNDSWKEASPIKLGRVIYGGSDDIEYLDNQAEYQAGWDWFRIDFEEEEGKLVFFELDLPDRDLPLQLLFYRHNAAEGSIESYTRGKDPMEVLHDGQKVRYSKFISRVLTRGRYYLAVLGNHPSYLLRTTVYPVPPYDDPRQALETAMHYILCIGDAWFAQIPRLGSRHRRSVMLHDEAQRCTACHPTVFPLESSLTAYANGYSIRAKSQFKYLMERVYNAPTPLYGNPGANWVRFVAIQLQFFGKQGSLVADYENLVTRKQTPLLGRYTGFLQAAWDHRTDLPEDENNGVSPIDSKFGFAWRDWRVLTEYARRTGDEKARASAHHIEEIFSSPESVARLEGTQDRLHRLHGMALMDRDRYRHEIAEAARYFLKLQNEDGGWPGHDEKPSGGERVESRESAEYLTGQAIHTLLAAGVDGEGRARLEKAGAWLLSRQREFGGWFQTDTIENFVTPMRETRYAIMALAGLYPRDRDPDGGLGNRDGKPARLPGTDSLLGTLDGLDNLWEVPEDRRREFTAAAGRFLRHENAWIRALAAQCLGRIGDAQAVEPLLNLLADPVKMVWQSASWALRQLGNRGTGIPAIRRALSAHDPAVRRGAARIFAYQFYGMDRRPDLLEAFFPLLDDPELLTRHQAVRTLAQWWYRSQDREIRRRIVQALVDRLSDGREHPVQRFNLSQALYTLVDENLGSPGTGYGRWIDYLEPHRQESLRAERRWQEQEILLSPIFEALIHGPAPQRIGMLMAFDGTPFWRGYASAAFGPGNDRAFDFERGNEFDKLGKAFQAVLSRYDQAEELSYGLRLGAFFKVFQAPDSQRLAPLYLEAVLHSDTGVYEAALQIADQVSLQGLEETSVGKLMQASSAHRKPAVLKLLRANPSLLGQRELADLVRNSVQDRALGSLALPLMASPNFTEEETLAALIRSWPASLPHEGQESENYKRLIERNSLLSGRELEENRRQQTVEPPQALLDCLALLEKRPALLEKGPVLLRLSGALRVDNGRIRQLAVELLTQHPQRASHRLLAPFIQQSLMDIRNEVRRAALKLMSLNAELLDFPELNDYLLRLLLDSDTRVRRGALELVAQENLISREPRLAGRVKALQIGESEAGVRMRAEAVLREAGLNPEEVSATASLSKPVLPDFEFFRKNVNSYFYQESSKDGRACANCHATHRILRLAEPPTSGQELSEGDIQNNYRSLLKVIDADDPEGSLVLRKPLSPSGQGEEDRSSPTGLTHVGGTRWSGREDPAYQAVLQWIRTAREN